LYSFFDFVTRTEFRYDRETIREMDLNGDGYASIKEVLDYLKLEGKKPGTNVSDHYNIFSKLHLGDVTVEEIAES